jgi:alpha-amylase
MPAFTSPQGNLSALVSTAVLAQQSYTNGSSLSGSFLENQDQPRFQNITTDEAVSPDKVMSDG